MGDLRRLDEGEVDEEFGRQGGLQGNVCGCQAEVCEERLQEVPRRPQAGAEGAGHHGFLCSERRDSAREGTVRQGQVHPWQVMRPSVLCLASCWPVHLWHSTW